MSDEEKFHHITHPETGEVLPLRRVTSFADVLDKYMLTKWKMKTVAHAVATQSHLSALASMWETSEQAVTEALKHKPDANMGTAGHKATELVDSGQSTVDDFLHEDVRSIADRYERLISHYPIKPVMSEQRVYNLDVGYCGHFDRIWEVLEPFEMYGWEFSPRELIVGDLKTGNFLDNEICLQQAAYVNAEGIVTEDGGFEPMPAVRKDVAFIVHVPQSKEIADLIPIRLDGAWEAFKGLALIWGWRGVRLKIPTELRRLEERKITEESCTATTPSDSPTPTETPSPAKDEPTTPSPTTDTSSTPEDSSNGGETLDSIRQRIRALPDDVRDTHLKRLWPHDVPRGPNNRFTSEQLDRIAAVLDTVEWEYTRKDVEPWPTTATTSASGPSSGDSSSGSPSRSPSAWGPTFTPPEEGPDVDLTDLKARVNSLTPEHRAILDATLKQSMTAQRSFHLKTPSLRRSLIVGAFLDIVDASDGDEEMIRLALQFALGVEVQPAVTLGCAVGSLTIQEAEKLSLLALALKAGTAHILFADDGSALFEGVGVP